MARRTIKVDYLARVEGEGSLWIQARDGRVQGVELRIFEPPRLFEAFLRGRDFSEAPDITARICGICPVAYQMSSVQAMENAVGMRVDGHLRELRRLLYFGEWIESHALHIFMLHAPDFLGYEDAVQMAEQHRDAVESGLRMKKAGNTLMRVVGGREVHPINVRLGGFYKAPSKPDLVALIEELEWGRAAAYETIEWAGTLAFPTFEQDYTFVALRHESEYPILDGVIATNRGHSIDVSEYEHYFTEEHVPHSNALHSTLKGWGAYLTGPLARYNLNFDRLPRALQDAARTAGLGEACRNPFQSIIVRSVELAYAFEEALRIIRAYVAPPQPFLNVLPSASTGYGISEAPRGILYHRYDLNADGSIAEARIVPPTSQNQARIEQDLWQFADARMALSDDQLTWECEQMVRNYDPCISCATHFLNVEVDRE